MNTQNRIKQGLTTVLLWWLLSAYVSGVIGALSLGKEALLINICVTTALSFFLAVGVIIGAKSSDSNDINLTTPKLEPAKKKMNSIDPCCQSSNDKKLMVYSSLIETRGRHGTIVVVAKDKETAKRRIIEKFPDCKLMFFNEWLRDGNHIIDSKLDD